MRRNRSFVHRWRSPRELLAILEEITEARKLAVRRATLVFLAWRYGSHKGRREGTILLWLQSAMATEGAMDDRMKSLGYDPCVKRDRVDFCRRKDQSASCA